MLHFTHF